MNSFQFWLKLVAQKPALSEPSSTVTIESAALKRLLERAFKAGRDYEREQAKDDSLFGSIFGNGMFK